MSNFEVGDRVKIIGHMDQDHLIAAGAEGEIVEAGNWPAIKLDDHDRIIHVPEYNLEAA